MTVVVFPDTCLFVNFASIGRMDLLGGIVGQRGRWSYEMYREVTDWSGSCAEEMAHAHDFMPAPIYPTPAEMVTRSMIRARFARPGDSTTAHLGEAEMLAVIEHRYGGQTVVVASEDRDVHSYCARNGLSPMSTRAVLELAAKSQRLTPAAANQYLAALRQQERGLLEWHPIVTT